MREIKIRVWFPKARRMVYFGGMFLCSEYKWLCFDIRGADCTREYQYLASESYIPDEECGIETVYTGLKDRNGKEIYEGDILGGIWEQCYIAWCDKCKAFQVFIVGLSSPKYCMACNGDVHWAEIVEDDSKLEVIGNIYENPELLKQPSINPQK